MKFLVFIVCFLTFIGRAQLSFSVENKIETPYEFVNEQIFRFAEKGVIMISGLKNIQEIKFFNSELKNNATKKLELKNRFDTKKTFNNKTHLFLFCSNNKKIIIYSISIEDLSIEEKGGVLPEKLDVFTFGILGDCAFIQGIGKGSKISDYVISLNLKTGLQKSISINSNKKLPSKFIKTTFQILEHTNELIILTRYEIPMSGSERKHR